jgi:hypothetical protein
MQSPVHCPARFQGNGFLTGSSMVGLNTSPALRNQTNRKASCGSLPSRTVLTAHSPLISCSCKPFSRLGESTSKWRTCKHRKRVNVEPNTARMRAWQRRKDAMKLHAPCGTAQRSAWPSRSAGRRAEIGSAQIRKPNQNYDATSNFDYQTGVSILKCFYTIS